MKTPSKNQKRINRHHKVRMKISGTSERPRLSVFRSNGHIYAQLIDDVAAKTLAAADDLKLKLKKGEKELWAEAKTVGSTIAEKAKTLGITKAVFDRGGYIYTGRVKALAEGAREGGLEF